jgi:hypothetical protein
MSAETNTWNVKLDTGEWITATGTSGRAAMTAATKLLAKQGRLDVRVVSASRQI